MMQRAFTLVEMLVAVAVTVVMLVAINQIFTTATEAISAGQGISRVIEDSRAVGEQIHRDADKMLGPSVGDAFLVIVQHDIRVPGSDMPNAQDAPSPDGVYVTERDRELGSTAPVRSDQILFFRKRKGLEPLAPEDGQSYNGTSNADTLRMWYGHALRTRDDGVPDADGDNSRDILGEPGTRNALAKDWVLARQALHLANDPGTVHFQGAWTHAPIAIPTGSSYANSAGTNVPARMYSGLHDVAEQQLFGQTASNNDGAVAGIIDKLDASGYAWDANPSTNAGEGVHHYTYAKDRLMVNPNPGNASFRPWQIGQMHPFMAGHVSDFIVEFAGNYDGNPGIDRDTDASGTDINGLSYQHDGGNIKWYAHDLSAAGGNVRAIENEPGTTSDDRATTVYVNDPTDPSNFDSTKPVVYPFPAGQSAPTVPTTLDPSNPHTFYNSVAGQGAHSNATASFLWVHDDDNADASDWPSLIRIRYRLHDPDGEVLGADDRPGKWFEQIIRVPRP